MTVPAQGAVQFGGAGAMRNMRLPVNTIQVRGQQICASIKGMPFDPCFNLNKNDNVSFRGSVSGLGFAYCDFRRQGNGRVSWPARSPARVHCDRRGLDTLGRCVAIRARAYLAGPQRA